MTVEVKVTRGDLTPEQFRGLAQIMRDYAGGYARTTVQQNFVLRWVREECVYDVWKALSELGLGEPGSREIDDVVSCPGTDSCKLGITSSMGLNEAVQERIEALKITDELTRKLNIKISGCPNGCGQHHVASIGFTGASIKVGEHTIPAYIPHVGGVFEGGEVAVRHAPEAAPAVQARAGGDRALDRPVRGQPQRRRGVERVPGARRHGRARGAGQGSVDARRLRVGDDEHSSSTGTATFPSKSFAARASARYRSDETRNRGPIRCPQHIARWHRPAPTSTRRPSLTHTLREAARHGERAVLLCSFQKEESVLLDELLRLDQGTGRAVRILTIDTGVLFEETMKTWRAFEERFGVQIEVVDASSPDEPWSGPEHCCSVAKVAALERSLAGAEGWITGIRREQGPTRAAPS